MSTAMWRLVTAALVLPLIVWNIMHGVFCSSNRQGIVGDFVNPHQDSKLSWRRPALQVPETGDFRHGNEQRSAPSAKTEPGRRGASREQLLPRQTSQRANGCVFGYP